MKTLLIISSILFLILAFSQVYIVRASIHTETQPYDVIRVEKDFEIRFYPVASMAIISSPVKNYKELGNLGFRRLASYIFGSNKTNEKISMTAPVHMDINNELSSMGFVMPKEYRTKKLPIPNDTTISIREIPQEYVAAIQFTGYASDEKIDLYTQKLKKLLDDAGIAHYGHFRFLGYNPPFQLFRRRNEIIVKVDWSANTNQ